MKSEKRYICKDCSWTMAEKEGFTDEQAKQAAMFHAASYKHTMTSWEMTIGLKA